MATSKAQTKESIASLYCLKGICALLVVAIHAPVGEWREYVNSVAAFAVPLFFTISGYFLYQEEPQGTRAVVTSAIKRLLPILLITQAVYSVLPHSGFPLGRDSSFYFKWLLTGVNHNNMHLWYIHSLLWSLGILYLVEYLRVRRIIPIFILFIPLHYYLSGFIFTDSHSVYWTSTLCFVWRYTFATALPYLALGYCIKQYERQLPSHLSTWLSIPLYFLCLFVIKEMAHNSSILIKPIAFVLSVYTIFKACLSHRGIGEGSLISYIGNRLSGNVYYWHIIILYIVSHHLSTPIYQNWGIFYTFVFSVLLAYLVSQLQRRIGITLLR